MKRSSRNTLHKGCGHEYFHVHLYPFLSDGVFAMLKIIKTSWYFYDIPKLFQTPSTGTMWRAEVRFCALRATGKQHCTQMGPSACLKWRQRRAGVIIAQPSLTRIAFPTQSQLCFMLLQTSVLCRTQVSSAPSPRLLNDATRIISSLTADTASSEELSWSPPCIQMVPCALWLYGASSHSFTDEK